MIDIEKVDRIDLLNKKEKVILEKYLQELSKKKELFLNLRNQRFGLIKAHILWNIIITMKNFVRGV